MSTYKELYEDFTDIINRFTQKVQVTQQRFMRDIADAMNEFQMRTLLLEKVSVITLQSGNFWFDLPEDCFIVKEIQDPNGRVIIPQDYAQASRANQVQQNGVNERMPLDYDYQLRKSYGSPSRYFSIVDRRILVSSGNYIMTSTPPDISTITVFYYPTVDRFSSTSVNWWADWYANGGLDFETLFRTTTMPTPLNQYEEYLINYIVMKLSESMNNIDNANIHSRKFEYGIQRAIAEKPSYFTEGKIPYKMSPRS